MNSINQLLVPLAFLACFTISHAFFTSYNKKSADMRSSANPPIANNGAPPPQWYRDVFPPWQPYSFDTPGPVAVAVPVAVPIQAQMPGGGQTTATLKGTLHNVQLVPCLCPMSRELDPMTPSSSQFQANLQSQSQPTAFVVQPSPVQSSSQDM